MLNFLTNKSREKNKRNRKKYKEDTICQRQIFAFERQTLNSVSTANFVSFKDEYALSFETIYFEDVCKMWILIPLTEEIQIYEHCFNYVV